MVLDSRTYKDDDLPALEHANVSNVVKIVVEMLLTCDSKKVSLIVVHSATMAKLMSNFSYQQTVVSA